MHEIISIGAGIAGLSAAATIQQKNTLLLESAPRLGGRVFTRHYKNISYELGAVLSFNPNLLSFEIANKQQVVDNFLVGILFRDKIYFASSIAGCLAKMPHDRNNFLNFKEKPQNLTNENHDLLNALHRVIRPGDFTEYPRSVLKDAFLRHNTTHFEKGNSLLIEALAQSCPGEIKLNCQVNEVKRQNGCWQVTFNSGEKTRQAVARTLVLALDPKAALQLKGLPDSLTNYLQSLKFFQYHVVAVVTNRLINTRFSYLVCPGQLINTIYNYRNKATDRSVFLFYIGDTESRKLAGKSDLEIENLVVDFASKLIPLEKEMVEIVEVKKWEIAEAVEGKRDSEKGRQTDFSNPCEGLYVCGDYLNQEPEKYGMHPAMLSGFRVGEKVKDYLKRFT